MALFACACGAPPSERPVADPVWGETSLVEDLRIGQYDGPPEYLLAGVEGIAQLGDGSIVIGEETRSSSRVLRYDAEGRFLNAIGRMGQGPGEYQRVVDVRPTPNGNVAIWDTRARRLTIMSPAGDFVSSFQADSGLNSSAMLLLDRAGAIYIKTWKDDPDDANAQRIHGYLKYAPTGDLVDTIWLPKVGRARGTSWVTANSDAPYSPFVRETVSMLTTDGVVVRADNERYELDWVLGDETLFSVSRQWEPIPLHPEELGEWQRRQARISGVEIPASVPVTDLPPSRYPPIPDTKPAIIDLWPGDDGTMWVRRYAEAYEWTDLPPRDPGDDRPVNRWWQDQVYDVFDREGVFLGSVTLPRGAWVVWRHPDYVWTVRSDEHGEAVAVRYRIVKEHEGEQ